MLTLFYDMCFSGWKSCESVPKLVQEYMAGELKVDEFITHSVPLDKINEAFDLMHSGKRLVAHPKGPLSKCKPGSFGEN